MSTYKETGWSATSELEAELAALEANVDQQFGETSLEEDEDVKDDEDYFDDLYCIACDKSFKTDKAFANHEKSKKHREFVAIIKAQMEADEAILADADLEDAVTAVGDVSETRTELADVDGETGEDEENGWDVNKGSEAKDSSAEIIFDEDLVTEEEEQPRLKLSKKQKKKRKLQEKLLACQQEEDIPKIAELTLGAKIGAEKPQSCQKIENTLEAKCSQIQDEGEVRLQGDDAEADAVVSRVSENGLAGSKHKRETPNVDKPKKVEHDQQGIPQNCNKCGKRFPSKTKLFNHLKETGHALRLDSQDTNPPVDDTKKGKKKKKGKK